jgi:hypothetical protein
LIRIDNFHENSGIAGDSRIAVPYLIGECLLGDQVTAERLVQGTCTSRLCDTWSYIILANFLACYRSLFS